METRSVLPREKARDLLSVGSVRGELEIPRVLRFRFAVAAEEDVDHAHAAVRGRERRVELQRSGEGGLGAFVSNARSDLSPRADSASAAALLPEAAATFFFRGS